MPLSQAEVGELSEGVREDQKKLMEAAPTEWNSGPGRTAKEAALAMAAKKKEKGGRRKGKGGSADSGDGEEDETGLVDQSGDDGPGDNRAGAGGVGVVDDDSSLGLLYRLLLAEMQGNGSSGGLNNRWIDRDALLQVRFAPLCLCLLVFPFVLAVCCQYPPRRTQLLLL